MKQLLKGISIIFMAALVFFAPPLLTGAQESKEVEVVFTHDLHSHLESFNAQYNGEMQQMGGFSRIKTILDERRTKNPELLYVDGGDFSMGTLYQTIYEEQASELRMLGFLGCDATTLGNHEFDYRSEGLINMMNTAKDSKEALPPVLLCNANLEGTEFANLGFEPYIVISKGDTRIAVIGVFGEDALKCAPTCTLTFQTPAEGVKKTVEEIKKNQNVDMIVCISHCGTSDNPKESEDEILAKKVPEIDLIISGHSHTLLEQPKVVGDTLIVSSGEYGSRLGTIQLRQNSEGRWENVSYELIPLTTAVEENSQALKKIMEFRADIDSTYLSQFGYTMDQVLTKNTYSFTPVNEIGKILKEETLGNFLSDSYIYSVKQAEGANYAPIAAAIIPSGVIRDTIPMGDVTVADIFNISSLGVGPDGVPGYPLISIYLTGKELKTVAEIDASIAPIMPTAQLYCSGLNYEINSNRIILNKVTDVYLTDMGGNREEIQNDKLYRVVADLYSGQMLNAVTDMSYGILSIVPKDESGNAVIDFEKCIIYDGAQELKAWAAIAHYAGSFEQIPAYYETAQGRKIVSDSRNIVELVKNPNKTTLVICAAIVVIVVLLIVMVRLIVKRAKQSRQRQ